MLSNREEMITKNLPLVTYVVRKLGLDNSQGSIEREDAIAYGVEGLIRAVDSFDPERGTAFSSFATQRIRGSVLDAVRRMDLMPRTLRHKTRELERASLELAGLYGRWPTAPELALRLGVSQDEVRNLMGHTGSRCFSLDQMMDSEVYDEVAPWEPGDQDELSDPAAVVDHQALIGLLGEALQLLPARDRQIIQQRYQEGRTFGEIARQLGVSESRICQLHRTIIERLQLQLRQELQLAA